MTKPIRVYMHINDLPGAWEEGRPRWAWMYLFLSAMHGALFFNEIL
jgi:hypothetical protein